MSSSTTRQSSYPILAAILVLILHLFAFAGEAAPRNSRRPTSPSTSNLQVKKWTVMIFMAADNNLEKGTDADLNEYEEVGSTGDVNLVVQIDRNGKYTQDSPIKWTGTKRFLIQKDNKPQEFTSKELMDLGEVDMADPNTLVEFARWCRENFPAERYALIFWNHGTGWKEIQPDLSASIQWAPSPQLEQALNSISYNISYDDTSGTSMDIPTLGTTLKSVVEVLGKPLEIVGFDACLMQMVEVGFSLAPHAKCMVGSADLETERGWPNDTIFRILTTRPDLDGPKFGELVVAAYKDSYSAGSQGNAAVTLSAMDLSKIPSFLKVLDEFCAAAKRNISDIDKFEQAREEALKYVYKDYIDLGHFLRLLEAKTTSPELKKAAGEAFEALMGPRRKGGLVAVEKHTGTKYDESCGVSIFFPDRSGFRTYKKRYKMLEMSKQHKWFEFLQEMESPSIPYLKIQEVVLDDKNHDGRIAPGESVKVKLLIRNLGKQTLKGIDGKIESGSNAISPKKADFSLAELPAPGKESLIPCIDFTVAADTALDTAVPLSITIQGEGIPAATYKTTFYVKSSFMSSGNVLLVFTDGFSPAAPILQAMLRDNKIKFDIWDRMLDGDVKPDVLKRYKDGWVLFSVQDSSDPQRPTSGEIEALTGFLKSGGRLVLSGQDLAFGLRETPFLKDFCKVGFVQDDTNVHVVKGTNGFVKEAVFQIFGGDGANNQKWPDEMDTLSGARTIMKFEPGARDLANDDDMNGPDLKPNSPTRGVKSSGTAGVSVNDGYRLMLFAFGLEAINSVPQRNSMIQAIAAFMNPEVDSQIRDLAIVTRRANGTTRSGQFLDDVELVNELQDRIARQVQERFESDPGLAAKALETIGSLPEDVKPGFGNLEKNIRSLLEFKRQHGTVIPR